MGTGILIGIVLCLILEGLGYVAWRSWHPLLPPQPPRTGPQLANELAFDEQERHTPRIVSLRIQRRTTRGRHRPKTEDGYGDFE
jgi:hypothetical protein